VKTRKWLPTFADLIDRLSIHQLKEVFIPEKKETYSRDMSDIENDLDILIEQGNIKLTGSLIRSIIVLAQMNEHIWYNESKVRKGDDQDLGLLKLTHGLNGVRNRIMNCIKYEVGESDRLDWKTDCLAAEFDDWKVSHLDNWGDKDERQD
jgi:hypothetical protein